MDMNIIVSGVGGQGILSIAFVLDNAAMKEGYHFKQAEVHGMSQRGGAVQSHLRFSKEEIWSDLISEGSADLVLSVEPLETLRYVHYLKPGGAVVSSTTPFVNIPDYPDVQEVYARIAGLKDHVLIDAGSLARLAGSPRAQNMVMLGAADARLPFRTASCLEYIGLLFKAKGEKAVKSSQDAYGYGRRMSAFYRAGIEQGLSPIHVRLLCTVADPRELEMDSLALWKEAFDRHPGLFAKGPENGDRIPATAEKAREAIEKGTC